LNSSGFHKEVYICFIISVDLQIMNYFLSPALILMITLVSPNLNINKSQGVLSIVNGGYFTLKSFSYPGGYYFFLFLFKNGYALRELL
jgi:hypothetical protein